MADTRFRTFIPSRFRAGELAGKGKVRNVSQGGLFVLTRAIPEVGESISLRLREPGRPAIEVRGLVWWTTRQCENPSARSGFGLRLLESNAHYRRLVQSLS